MVCPQTLKVFSSAFSNNTHNSSLQSTTIHFPAPLESLVLMDNSIYNDQCYAPQLEYSSLCELSPEQFPTASTSYATERHPSLAGPIRTRVARPCLPLDAPIQPRRYLTPSRTSKQAVPKSYERVSPTLSMYDGMDREEDELVEELHPNATDAEVIEHKRRKNTLAARKSRARKLMHTRDLEEQVSCLRAEVQMWKTRANTLQQLMAASGINVPVFD